MTSYFVLATTLIKIPHSFPLKIQKLNIQPTSSSVQNTSVVGDELYEDIGFQFDLVHQHLHFCWS